MAGTKGRSGRRKKPAEIKKRERTFRSDRDCDAVSFPSADGPGIPKKLHPDAVKEWKRLAPICRKMGLLTEGDWLAWRLGFAAFSTWLYASEQITHPGSWSFKTDKGYEGPVPEIAIAKQAYSAVLMFCREFGLTPSSRSSLNIKVEGVDEADPMEGLLN